MGVQGRPIKGRFWYQSKASMQLSISDHLQPWSYIAHISEILQVFC